MTAKKGISLSTAPPFDLTLWGRMINWLTTVGRVIVVLTELIVVGAFISRFWLDRENSDLSEEIRQKRTILESSVEFENDFRSLQKRLKNVTALVNENSDLEKPIQIIAQEMPGDIFLNSFVYSKTGGKKSASFSILVFSESSLSEFIDNLSSSPEISSLRVGSIKKEKLIAGTKINLSVSFKEDEKN